MKKLLIASLFLLSSIASAQVPVTDYPAIKAKLLAEPAVAIAVAQGIDWQVRDWLNAPSATYVVWRTSVSVREYEHDAIVWTAVDTLTVGKARIWEWMKDAGTLNPSKLNVRQGFADAFGAASATTVAAAAVSKRFATNLEAITATGLGTTASPSQLTYEGSVTNDEVAQILRGI